MKAVAAILLVVIVSNSFLYDAWFQVSVILVKAGVCNAISLMDDDDIDKLLKIPVSNLEKDESDEVWYKGSLYDVVKREEDSNKVNCVYVLSDETEEGLLSGAADYFKSDTDNNCPDHCKIHGLKNSHSPRNLQYTIHNSRFSISDSGMSTGNFAFRLCGIPSCKSEVPAPPPKPDKHRKSIFS